MTRYRQMNSSELDSERARLISEIKGQDMAHDLWALDRIALVESEMRLRSISFEHTTRAKVMALYRNE